MDDKRIELTQDIVDELKHHAKRTKVGGKILLKSFLKDAPRGLKANNITAYTYRPPKTVIKSHIDFILGAYRLLPDDETDDSVMIELTPELALEVRHHRIRTGIGSTKLLNIFSDSAPKGIKYNTINSIAKYAQKTVQQNHINFILNAYRSMPDNDDVIIELTPELVQEIKYHQKRTGAGSIKLVMDSAYEVPEGLKPSIISNILSLLPKTARQSHIDFILYTYRSLPDIDTYIIDDKTIDEIKSHIERTGLGVQALLKGKRHKKPKGFSSGNIQAILFNGARNVKREYVEFVLNEYRALPDWDDVYIENSAHIQDELKSLASATGLPLARIFKSRDDLPDGLNIGIYSSWFNPKKPTSSIKSEHYTYLIKLFKSLAE